MCRYIQGEHRLVPQASPALVTTVVTYSDWNELFTKIDKLGKRRSKEPRI